MANSDVPSALLMDVDELLIAIAMVSVPRPLETPDELPLNGVKAEVVIVPFMDETAVSDPARAMLSIKEGATAL